MASKKNIPRKIKIVDQQQMKWFFIISLCLTCVFFISSAMLPSLEALRALKKQLKVQEITFKVGENKIKTLTELKEKFQDIQDKLDRRQVMFFNGDEAVSSFLKELSPKTEKVGGQIVEIKPDSEEELISPKPNDNETILYKKSLVQVDWKGSFGALLKFFEMLKTEQKVIGVEEIKIDFEKSSNRNLSVHFTLVLYKLTKSQ